MCLRLLSLEQPLLTSCMRPSRRHLLVSLEPFIARQVTRAMVHSGGALGSVNVPNPCADCHNRDAGPMCCNVFRTVHLLLLETMGLVLRALCAIEAAVRVRLASHWRSPCEFRKVA